MNRRILLDRLDEGEDLYFQLGARAHGALIVACSAGAIVVAYPTAYLVGRSLTFWDPRHEVPTAPMPSPRSAAFDRWSAAVPPFHDRRAARSPGVVLIDDGLLPPVDLVTMACELRNAGATSLVVAAPWVHPAARPALARVADVVLPRRCGPEPEWYADPPDGEQAINLLADVLQRNRLERTLGAPVPAPSDEPFT